MDPLAAKIASPDRGRGDLTANSPRQKEYPEPAMKKMELEVISERVSKSPTSDIENTDCGNVKNDWSVKSRRKSNTNSPNGMPLSPVCGNVKKDSYVRRQRGSDTHSPNYMPLYPNTSATSLVVSRRRFPRLTVILQISVFLCVFTPSYSSASSKQNKSPLISSTAENVKYFLKNEGVMGRSTVDNSADPDTLDFQTLKVIKKWGNTTDILLVSGRDYVYMLDSTVANGAGGRLNHLERLTWITPTKSQRECIMMGKKEYECHNFIRVVELMENGELMVCGTNAYAPTCRYYIRENFDAPKSGNSIFHTEEVCRGQCIVPFNPATASATLYTNTDNGYRVFTAVVNGFLSDDPIILQKSSPSSSIFTNTLWLNEPTFLKIVEYGDKIYVFFREIAKESESGTSEKVTYARVAQICKNDQGGEKVLVNQWSTFLKSRIRCGYSGHQYMQFDHMTSVSDVVTVTDENEQPMLAVVATFTTPQEWEDASLSAVCVYSMEDIASVFENGNFLGEYELDVKPKPMPEMPSVGGPSFSAQASMKKITRSYPIPSEDVPSTRPGSCGKQYQPDELYFAKEHPLMYDVVEPYFKAPIYVSYNNVRTTQIAVDDSAGGHGKAMIYLGTKDGKIMRLRTMFNGEGESPKAMLLESTQIDNCGDEDDCSILSLHVSRPLSGPSSRPSAFVAFSDYMVQFPLTRCNLYKNEACCSMDPYCGWSSNRKSCIDRTTSNSDFLEPTRNNVRNIPESCMIDSSDRADTTQLPVTTSALLIRTHKVPMETSQAGGGAILALMFFIGMLCGILCGILVFLIRRRKKSHGKHTVNKRRNSSEKKECSRTDQSHLVDNTQNNPPQYMVIGGKAPQRPGTLNTSQEQKYSLPPSPTPSEGHKAMEFEVPLVPKNSRINNRPLEFESETSPLVAEPTSDTVSKPTVSTAPGIPPKQSSKKVQSGAQPAIKLMQSPQKKPTPSPNQNNSNNHHPAPNGTTPPTLPLKESSLRKNNSYPSQPPDIAPQYSSLRTPVKTHPSSTHPTPMHPAITQYRQPSLKKFQSFGGYDSNRVKPPVPTKTMATIEAYKSRRPQSLAPPTSIKRIEDIPNIKPQPFPRTPPINRSNFN